MLEWTIITKSDEEVCVRLKGDITERVTFDDLELDRAHVVLVPDGIRYVNSTGVKRLLEFLEDCRRHASVELERCSPAIVAQLNLVPRLADCVQVRSVIAPLECAECVAVRDVLVTLRPGAGAPEVAELACEVCGAPMLLAELEERYFAFSHDK